MKETEPQLYHEWSIYMRLRQAMLSAATFNSSGWNDWEVGHAKLVGILLWHYENGQKVKFKYSRILKKQCYRRTHNYRLLKGITEAGILKTDGKGYYSFQDKDIHKMEKAIKLMRQLDQIDQKGRVTSDV